MKSRAIAWIVTLFSLAACDATSRDTATARSTDSSTPAATTPRERPSRDDSAAAAFGDSVAAMLLDTNLHELRGHLSVKIVNPNRDDESPLADRDVEHPAAPGPHTYDGKLVAEIGALRALLGDSLPISIEGDRVFIGRPERLILGHLHGDALYVPVKLFARLYGVYVDIGCPLANCGTIWPRAIMERMRDSGNTGGSGVLEGHAEGLLNRVDVRNLPRG